MEGIIKRIKAEIDQELYEQFDITCVKSYFSKCYIDATGLKRSSSCNEIGFSIRVLDKRKRYAQVSFTEEIKIDNLKKLLSQSLELGDVYPNKELFCDKTGKIDVYGIFDKELELISDIEHEENFRDVVNKLESDDINIKNGSYVYSFQEIFYFNPISKLMSYKSNGITIQFVLGINNII